VVNAADLLSDEAHHVAQLVADLPAHLMRSRIADNRRKLDAEVARILD